MTDDLLGEETPYSATTAHPLSSASPTRHNAGGMPGIVFVAGQALCLALGIVAVLGRSTPFLALGYIACGVVLPLLWAGFFLRQKRLSVYGQCLDTEWLQRVNRVLLWAGIAIALACAWFIATELAK